MADEFAITSGLQYAKGALEFSAPTKTVEVDQSASTPALSCQVLTIGTSEEDVAFGDVSTPGIAIIENLDATNYVEYGPKSGGSMILFGKAMPGDFDHRVRLGAGVTLRMKANTAACRVKITVFDA